MKKTMDTFLGMWVAEQNLSAGKELVLRLRFFNTVVRLLVGLTMLAIGFWLVSGIWVMMVDVYAAVQGNWGEHAERVIIRLLTILALLELWRTLQSYLDIGRVRVTFIVDAAMVVLIGELIGLWYRDHSYSEVLLSLGVILALAMLRILTMRFSPENQDQ